MAATTSTTSSSTTTPPPVVGVTNDNNDRHLRFLRIGTFNVHGFSNGNWVNTFEQIVTQLYEADLDIIGLQEAPGKFLDKLINHLNYNNNKLKNNDVDDSYCPNHQWSYRLATKFGETAIITRLVEDLEEEQQRGMMKKKCPERFSRCTVVLPTTPENPLNESDRDNDKKEDDDDDGHECTNKNQGCPLPTTVPKTSLEVMNLHLDHRRETTRKSQLKNIVDAHNKAKLSLPHIWLGDLNALTQSDYSTKAWMDIRNIRERNGWELPLSDVTTLLTTHPVASTRKKNSKKGLPGLGLSDTYIPLLSQKVRTQQPISTCRFGTRIDYIYFNHDYLLSAGWQLKSYEVKVDSYLSDHNLVIATFEKIVTRINRNE